VCVFVCVRGGGERLSIGHVGGRARKSGQKTKIERADPVWTRLNAKTDAQDHKLHSKNQEFIGPRRGENDEKIFKIYHHLVSIPVNSIV
jgi:hypothetical protein